MSIKSWLKNNLKKSFAALGFHISRIPPVPSEACPKSEAPDAPSLYMEPAMIQAAAQAGIYIGDYAEAQWGEVGSAKSMVETLCLPNLQQASTILEVGPGTGRYTKLMLEKIPQGKAHLFELDPYWKNFLGTYFSGDSRVILHSANGYSYETVASDSVDLYCANAVFVYTRPMLTYRNLMEAVRVVKPNGVIIFDFFDLDETEDALGFIETNTFPEPDYWSLDSLAFFTHFMAQRGCKLEQTYRNKCHNYHSTYALFRKCL